MALDLTTLPHLSVQWSVCGSFLFCSCRNVKSSQFNQFFIDAWQFAENASDLVREEYDPGLFPTYYCASYSTVHVEFIMQVESAGCHATPNVACVDEADFQT